MYAFNFFISHIYKKCIIVKVLYDMFCHVFDKKNPAAQKATTLTWTAWAMPLIKSVSWYQIYKSMVENILFTRILNYFCPFYVKYQVQIVILNMFAQSSVTLDRRSRAQNIITYCLHKVILVMIPFLFY